VAVDGTQLVVNQGLNPVGSGLYYFDSITRQYIEKYEKIGFSIFNVFLSIFLHVFLSLLS